jgi:hypothetical protein
LNKRRKKGRIKDREIKVEESKKERKQGRLESRIRRKKKRHSNREAIEYRKVKSQKEKNRNEKSIVHLGGSSSAQDIPIQ